MSDPSSLAGLQAQAFEINQRHIARLRDNVAELDQVKTQLAGIDQTTHQGRLLASKLLANRTANLTTSLLRI